MSDRVVLTDQLHQRLGLIAVVLRTGFVNVRANVTICECIVTQFLFDSRVVVDNKAT